MSRRNWIPVDLGSYDEPREIGMSADVEVNVFISPFEIPRAVRGYYDDAQNLFRIEFKYITHEKPIARSDIGPSEVTTIVGSKTGRILGFEIDVDALGATSVSLGVRAEEEVHKAIAAVREDAAPPDPDPWSRIRLNSHVTDRVLQDRRDEVFSSMSMET